MEMMLQGVFKVSSYIDKVEVSVKLKCTQYFYTETERFKVMRTWFCCKNGQGCPLVFLPQTFSVQLCDYLPLWHPRPLLQIPVSFSTEVCNMNYQTELHKHHLEIWLISCSLSKYLNRSVLCLVLPSSLQRWLESLKINMQMLHVNIWKHQLHI